MVTFNDELHPNYYINTWINIPKRKDYFAMKTKKVYLFGLVAIIGISSLTAPPYRTFYDNLGLVAS